MGLVIVDDNKTVATSRMLAKKFKLHHYSVLRRIRELNCSPEFKMENFQYDIYIDKKGEVRPQYLITADGFGVLGLPARVVKEFSKEIEELLEEFRIKNVLHLQYRLRILQHLRDSENYLCRITDIEEKLDFLTEPHQMQLLIDFAKITGLRDQLIGIISETKIYLEKQQYELLRVVLIQYFALTQELSAALEVCRVSINDIRVSMNGIKID